MRAGVLPVVDVLDKRSDNGRQLSAAMVINGAKKIYITALSANFNRNGLRRHLIMRGIHD